MKLLTRLPSWMKNKFLIATLAFVAWMLFFDERDVFTMYHHRQELKDLQQSKKYYTEQIDKERTELENLKNNPATLEKYAREKYYMKRDNEDLFLVPERQPD
jgi:cell division protein FtsB